MNRSQTFERLTRETLEQHRQIHFYFDRIASTLDALDPTESDREPMRRLAAQIEGLTERLLEHYRDEERGGLFEAILETMPDCRVEVGRLTKQHARLIEILQMARIHAERGAPSQIAELREDLRGFLEQFRRHEREEDELLRRALEVENAASE